MKRLIVCTCLLAGCLHPAFIASPSIQFTGAHPQRIQVDVGTASDAFRNEPTPAMACHADSLSPSDEGGMIELHALRFQENLGQVADDVGRARPDILFTAQAPGGRLYLRRDGFSVVFHSLLPPAPAPDTRGHRDPCTGTSLVRISMVEMTLVGCRTNVHIRRELRHPGGVQHYRGHCPQGVTDVGEYGRIVYEDILPNIDLVCTSLDGRFKYSFIVRPGGRVGDIRMRFDGNSSVSLADNGRLVVESTLGSVEEDAPTSHLDGSMEEVATAFQVDGTTVTFRIASYDSTRTLIIDPWSTYLGGSGSDMGNGIVLDGTGHLIVTGQTLSMDFPTLSALQGTNAGNYDAWVAKYDTSGTRKWITYYGGSGSDIANDVAMAAGTIAVVGETTSADFPLQSPVQATLGGVRDAFLLRLNSNGTRIQATYFGGTADDAGLGISADPTGAMGITGYTYSADFPCVSAAQGARDGSEDAFVARFTPSGTCAWSTYHGGSGEEYGQGVSVDPSGNTFVVGSTTSNNYPTLNLAGYHPQPNFGGGSNDGFVVKFDAAGVRRWSSYIGGNGDECGFSIKARSGDRCVIGCYTTSTNPSQVTTDFSTNSGGWDAMLAWFNSANALVYLSYYGGSGNEYSIHRRTSLNVNPNGGMTLVGSTASTDFPTAQPQQTTNAGGRDVFVIQAPNAGCGIMRTYLGGTGDDDGNACAVDVSSPIGYAGNTYITGSTSSPDFPTRRPSQGANAGGMDAFLTKLPWCLCPVIQGWPGGSTMHLCSGDEFVCPPLVFIGTPQPVPSLQVSTDGGASWTDVPGVTAPDYRFTVNASHDWNRYRIILTNRCGVATTSPITLNVSNVPGFLLQPPDTTLCMDQLMEYSIAHDSHGSTFQWQVDSSGGFRNLDNTPPYDGATTRKLTISAVDPFMHGNRYRCLVRVPACRTTDTSRTATLTVHSRPQILLHPADLSACVGSDTALVVLIAGSPTPALQWQVSTNTGATWIDLPGQTAASCRLLVDSAMHGRLLRVIATNPCGTETSLPAALSITRQATILRQPADAAACHGGRAMFVVKSDGTTFRWQEDRGAGFVDISAQPPHHGVFTDTLIIHPATTDMDGRRLRCIVSNACPTPVISAAATLHVHPTPVATILPFGTFALCPGDRLDLHAPADSGLGWQWYCNGIPLAGATTPVLQASVAGSYTVVVARGGCADTSDATTITMRVPPAASILAGGALRFCQEGEVRLHGPTGPDLRHTWLRNGSPSGDTTASIIVRDSASWQVVVVDAFGCSDTSDAVEVCVLPLPSAAITGPGSVCPGATARYMLPRQGARAVQWRLSGGGSPLTPMTGDSVIIRWESTGTWSLCATITDPATGCTHDTCRDVTIDLVLTPAIIALGPLEFCEGDSVILDCGGGWQRQRWSTGDTLRTLTVSHSGLYHVTVWDDVGCSGTSVPTAITVHPRPSISITGPVTACPMAPVTYTAPDGAGITHAWRASGGVILSGHTTASVTVQWQQPGEDTLHLTLSAASGCVADTTIIVHVQSSLTPVISMHGPAVACEGDTVTLDAGEGYARVVWSTGDSTRALRVIRSGQYFVSVQDSAGCTGTSAAVTITFHPVPDATIAGPATVCRNTPTAFAATALPGSSYHWSSTTGLIRSGEGTSDIVIEWPASTTDTLRVQHRSAAGCVGEGFVVVHIPPSSRPVITADRATTTCEGDTVVLDAGPEHITHRWNTGETGRSIRVTRSGVFAVTTTDSIGCSSTSDSVIVTFQPPPAPIISTADPSVLCEGDTARLAVVPAFPACQWFRNGTPIPGATQSSLGATLPGMYTAHVVDSIGCSGTTPPHTLDVRPSPHPVITLSGATLTSSVHAQYQWFRNGARIIGAVERTHTAGESGSYMVCVTDTNGCTGCSDTVMVNVSHATAVVGFDCGTTGPVPSGTVVSLPLLLLASQGLPDAMSAFTLDVAFDLHVVHPLFAFDTLGIQERRLHARVTGTRAGGDVQGVLHRLPFIVLASDTACTDVVINGVAWGTGDVATTVQGQSCPVCVELCHQGGDRLFLMDRRVSLMQNHPNPFNAETWIDYETMEVGHTELLVVDAFGRRIATLFAGIAEPGRHGVRFEGTAFASGMYRCILRTPSTTLSRTMIIVK